MSPEAKRFQPRVVASFNIAQLERVGNWFGLEVIVLAQLGDYTNAFAALETAAVDERNKPIDDKGRRRLQLGLDALILTKEQAEQGFRVHGEIQAWQLSSSDNDISLRYKLNDSSLWDYSMRPPSLEFNAAKNEPVASVTRGNPIDVDQLVQKAEDTRKQIEEVRDLVQDKFGASTTPFIGLLMSGEKKVVTNPDGSAEEADWTLSDLFSEWDRQGEIEEREVRKQLAEEIILALKYQHDFFLKREEPREYRQSEQVIEYTFALLEWVMKSPDNITERYPVPSMVTETRSAAEMLEVIRRIVLKPTYMIMEGIAKSDIRVVRSYEDDFWETLDDRKKYVEAQMKNPKDFDEYMVVQEKVAHEKPQHYSEKEWQEILLAEMQYLLEYAQECAQRLTYDFDERVDFVSSLTKDGKPVYPDEFIARAKQEVNELMELMKGVNEVGEFDQLLPWIKGKLGDDATYQTFFKKIGAIRQPQEQENPTLAKE